MHGRAFGESRWGDIMKVEGRLCKEGIELGCIHGVSHLMKSLHWQNLILQVILVYIPNAGSAMPSIISGISWYPSYPHRPHHLSCLNYLGHPPCPVKVEKLRLPP